ncbi:hypothetical protein [Streptomyces sp. NBC_01353]|uniref:hypothetical protein n=1 Tax=Streptomyces sp. NBC_01353 TaxID=2903835 RepID=UPI002E37108D|nr:hypothetical protein [Streptomyces sp. NBC_01353]
MQDVLGGLAENPALPERLFERLVEAGEEDVRLLLARRDDLTETQARTLRAHDDVDVWTLVAHRKITWAEVPRDDPHLLVAAAQAGIAPEAAVRELAAHPDREVRAGLAFYVTGLPPDLLAALARDADPHVAASAAQSPELSSGLAEELARHPHVVVRAEFARNEHAPPALLASLLADGGHPAPTRCAACHSRDERCADHWPGVRRIRLAAATNPAVPPAGLEEFLDADEAWVVDAFAERTDLPPHVHPRLAAHPVASLRATVARNATIGESLLLQLADDPDPDVSLAVAENPAVPLARLAALAGRARLPREPLPRILAATDAELHELAGSRVAQVRALVAARPDLPAGLLNLLVADPDIGVARRIAPHPALGEHRLADLVERHGPPVYGAAARNPGCPPALLRRMARDAESVRKALRTIAAHPATPPDVVEGLLADPDPRVAHAAAAHPSLPVETMERLVEQAAEGRPRT